MKYCLDFDSKSWARGSALVFIFFSNLKKRNSREDVFDFEEEGDSDDDNFYDLVTEQVTHYLTDISDVRPPNSVLGQINENLIKSRIKTLTEFSPALSVVEHASPLLWIRFAFTALQESINVSDCFLKNYAQWRLRRSIECPGETIGRLNEAITSPEIANASDIEGYRIFGYPLDSFFFSLEGDADLNCKSEWGLLRPQKQVNDRFSRRSIEDVIGRAAYKRISECLSEAAKNKTIDGLSNRKIKGRFLSSMPRILLARALLRQYENQLDCRASTIVRALPDFVACPNHRSRHG